MKTLVLTLAALLPLSAFASHPHDRVCVGSAAIPGQDPVEFVLQWEIGRTYQIGDPNKDPHLLTVEASSCYGDYMDANESCVKSSSGEVIVAGGNTSLKAPVVLKDAKGYVFFQGTFSWATKTSIIGKIAKGPGNNDTRNTMADVKVTLSCVSQPRLKLEQVNE